MAIQISPRTAIIAGAAVLVVAVGAGAWFFFLAEDEPPPRPAPAATAPKAAPKDTSKDAAKAPAAAPAAAKPIPSDPARLVAEIVELSGVRAQMERFASELGEGALASNQGQAERQGKGLDPAMVVELVNRHFEPGALVADVANSLMSGFEGERMGRFLEVLRSPAVLKLANPEAKALPVAERMRMVEKFRREPPAGERARLLQAVDELMRFSETGAQYALRGAREVAEAVFEGLQKAGRRVPVEARQDFISQLGAAEPQFRAAFRAALPVIYRDASDADLAAFVKALDGETGRWGLQALVAAQKSATDRRLRPYARDIAQLVLAQQLAAKPAAKEAVAAAPAAAAPAPAAPAAPVVAPEPPAYQRPANIRPLYGTKYNDLVTAVVMRDSVAVRELLGDGKNPNARQSDGLTALMIAVGNGDAAIAELLLAKRADPNLVTPTGHTAMAIARGRNSSELVRLLERYGGRG